MRSSNDDGKRDRPSERDLPKEGGPLKERAIGWAKAFFARWSEDVVASRAAALSFYTAFSLAPILLLVSIVASFVLDQAAVQQAIVQEASGLMGEQGGSLLTGMLDRASRPGQGWSAIFAIALLVVGATTAFAQLKDSLDAIFDVPATASSGLWTMIRTRLLSIGLIVTLAFLLLVSLAADAAFAGLSNAISDMFGVAGMWIGRIVAWLTSLVGAFLLFFVVYWLLPGRRLPMRSLLYGTLITTVLFSIGRVLIGIYLGHSNAVSAFGAAGSLALVLLWVDYSALVFFAGAEISSLIEQWMQRRAGASEPSAASASVALAGAGVRNEEIKLAEDRIARARHRLALHTRQAAGGLRDDLIGPKALLAAAVTTAGYLFGRRVWRHH